MYMQFLLINNVYNYTAILRLLDCMMDILSTCKDCKPHSTSSPIRQDLSDDTVLSDNVIELIEQKAVFSL
jgi:hypothetical protein